MRLNIPTAESVEQPGGGGPVALQRNGTQRGVCAAHLDQGKGRPAPERDPIGHRGTLIHRATLQDLSSRTDSDTTERAEKIFLDALARGDGHSVDVDALCEAHPGGRNAQSQTVQSSTGPFVAEVINGAAVELQYSTDTEGNNSGSPVVWNANGLAIGIHSNGGCNASASSFNRGVSFEHNALESALRDFVATNALFVDAGMPGLGVAANGTVFRPYLDLATGVSNVASGGVVNMVAGTYSPASSGTYSISTPMTIEATGGTVSISD
jgi:hypothetical protein